MRLLEQDHNRHHFARIHLSGSHALLLACRQQFALPLGCEPHHEIVDGTKHFEYTHGRPSWGDRHDFSSVFYLTRMASLSRTHVKLYTLAQDNIVGSLDGPTDFALSFAVLDQAWLIVGQREEVA